jgi:Txe/YoeB family toxin of Txe-Axe toxin-antitoxin module
MALSGSMWNTVRVGSRGKKKSPIRGEPARRPWRIHFFQRHRQDDPKQSVPARDFLLACPEKVRAMMVAVVKAVADAPPPMFSGGGKWEAMHGDMAGWYEIRVDGPNRHHYRLFCLLERDGMSLGLGGPSLVLITGKAKAFRTVLSVNEYAEVRILGEEYRARNPRSLAP